MYILPGSVYLQNIARDKSVGGTFVDYYRIGLCYGRLSVDAHYDKAVYSGRRFSDLNRVNQLFILFKVHAKLYLLGDPLDFSDDRVLCV